MRMMERFRAWVETRFDTELEEYLAAWMRNRDRCADEVAREMSGIATRAAGPDGLAGTVGLTGAAGYDLFTRILVGHRGIAVATDGQISERRVADPVAPSPRVRSAFAAARGRLRGPRPDDRLPAPASRTGRIHRGGGHGPVLKARMHTAGAYRTTYPSMSTCSLGSSNGTRFANYPAVGSRWEAAWSRTDRCWAISTCRAPNCRPLWQRNCRSSGYERDAVRRPSWATSA